jgi:hypothetical protein
MASQEYGERMDDELDEVAANDGRDRVRRKPPAGQGGGALYGVGLIGALAWYCQQAELPIDYVMAVLKALAWPAFLVYEAFKALDRVPSD